MDKTQIAEELMSNLRGVASKADKRTMATRNIFFSTHDFIWLQYLQQNQLGTKREKDLAMNWKSPEALQAFVASGILSGLREKEALAFHLDFFIWKYW